MGQLEPASVNPDDSDLSYWREIIANKAISANRICLYLCNFSRVGIIRSFSSFMVVIEISTMKAGVNVGTVIAASASVDPRTTQFIG